MLDRDVPPAEEEETGGGAVVVHRITVAVAADKIVIARTITIRAASTPRPWITAIGLCLATAITTGIRGRDPVRVLEGHIVRPNRNRCLYGKTQAPASSPSSMICFSWPRSRRRHER